MSNEKDDDRDDLEFIKFWETYISRHSPQVLPGFLYEKRVALVAFRAGYAAAKAIETERQNVVNAGMHTWARKITEYSYGREGD